MLGKLDIKIDGVQEFVNSLMSVGAIIPEEMAALMESSAQEAEDMMRNNISSKTGSLASSIDHVIEGSGNQMKATIGPNDGNFGGRKVGIGAEMGKLAGKGFPNWFDISNRYGVSLGVGFLIAKKIHEEGSSGIYYGRKTMDVMEAVFSERGIQMLYQVASRY